MPVCPKCRMTFTYIEDHVCEGHDHTKIWLLVAVAGGALVGGPLGLLVGSLYGQYVIGQACSKPGATNLCGLSSSFAVPSYLVLGVALGAVLGAAIAAIVITAVMGRRVKA